MTKTNETLTRYIKNWAVSTNFKGCSSHLTLCGLTDNRSEMPNFSYTQPLALLGATATRAFERAGRQPEAPRGCRPALSWGKERGAGNFG